MTISKNESESEICSWLIKNKIMKYKEHERMTPACLECGDKIRYGRSDKKFCCEDCKNRYYNEKAREGRRYRRKVMSQLSRNYEILEKLYRAGVTSMPLSDLHGMGFIPSVATAYNKVRCHDEYRCFDIKYFMTSTRIFSISKIQNV